MKPRYLLAVAASVFATSAAGQAEPEVTQDGSWLATIQAADGSRQSARFVIREFSGDWIGAGGRSPATAGACAGKKLPITVQASTPGALDFTVWGSQISPEVRQPDDRGQSRRQGRVRGHGRVDRHDPRDAPVGLAPSSQPTICTSERGGDEAGIARTSAHAHFAHATGSRFVRSWLDRRSRLTGGSRFLYCLSPRKTKRRSLRQNFSTEGDQAAANQRDSRTTWKGQS